MILAILIILWPVSMQARVWYTPCCYLAAIFDDYRVCWCFYSILPFLICIKLWYKGWYPTYVMIRKTIIDYIKYYIQIINSYLLKLIKISRTYINILIPYIYHKFPLKKNKFLIRLISWLISTHNYYITKTIIIIKKTKKLYILYQVRSKTFESELLDSLETDIRPIIDEMVTIWRECKKELFRLQHQLTLKYYPFDFKPMMYIVMFVWFGSLWYFGIYQHTLFEMFLRCIPESLVFSLKWLDGREPYITIWEQGRFANM